MVDRKPVTIDVISDVVCPWCYLGMKRLEIAQSELGDVSTVTHWRPYQLDPTIPPQGIDRNDYMIGKFGSLDRLNDAHKRLVDLGHAVGISYDFDAIKMSPNTLDAHRVIRWAGNTDPALQQRVVSALFSAYFEHGQDIGDRGVLVEIAGACDMDAALVASLLPTEADVAEVRREIATASDMGVTGVPCFVLAGKYAVMGAQEAGALREAIAQVAEQAA